MTDTNTNYPNMQPWQAGTPTNAGPQDVVTQLKGIVQQLAALVKAFSGRVAYGTFTLTAAPSTVVVQPGVQANSVLQFSPLNASAATLQGSNKSLYYTIIPGTSFTVFTASGGNAAGTEQFSYTINTPT